MGKGDVDSENGQKRSRLKGALGGRRACPVRQEQARCGLRTLTVDRDAVSNSTERVGSRGHLVAPDAGHVPGQGTLRIPASVLLGSAPGVTPSPVPGRGPFSAKPERVDRGHCNSTRRRSKFLIASVYTKQSLF